MEIVTLIYTVVFHFFIYKKQMASIVWLLYLIVYVWVVGWRVQVPKTWFIIILNRLRLSHRLAGSSPENIVYYYTLSSTFQVVDWRVQVPKMYFNLA